MPVLEPWQSWAIALVGIGALAIYYSQTNSKRRSRAGVLQYSNAAKRRTSPRRNSNIDPGLSSGNSRSKSQGIPIDGPEISSSVSRPTKSAKPKNRKAGNPKAGSMTQSSAANSAPPQGEGVAGQDAEEEIDNKEFAKQMAGLKTGSTLVNSEGSKKKSKKQGKQAELPLSSYNPLASQVNGASGSKDLSNPSSTTGAEADDDLSPATSPQLAASQAATSGDVSDMLEAPTKGRSVLRLTEVEEPKRTARPQKAVQEAESKKQRQNRRKKEEQKAARDEAERERRVLLEKQLRASREAEGRPAKNGMGSAPATNAWSKPSKNNNNTSSSAAPPPASNGSLLDTFDDGPKSPANGLDHQKTTAANEKAWHKEVPSEEEQLRILSEIEGNGGWNTVQAGRKKKPAVSKDKENQRKLSNASASLSGGTSTSGDSINQATPSQSQTDDEGPRVPGKKVDVDRNIWNFDNIKDHPEYDSDYPHALLGHPGDSDWAVV
ncbi:MAG: hypothetical protein Q9169_005359 [Polycauliona sp. 2 TL-2023]